MRRAILTSAFYLFYCINTHAQTSFLDPAFGSGGEVIGLPSPIYASGSSCNNIVVTSNNKILVAATTGHATVIRYLENGTIDSTFSNNGIFTGLDESDFDDMTLQSDGKILTEGTDFGCSCVLVGRLDTNGVYDTTFGNEGIALENFSFGSTDFGNGIALQPDNKIIVAGTDNETYIGLMRFLPNGRLDTTFGDTGVTTIYVPILPVGVALMSDGRIVSGGVISPQNALAGIRFLANGNIDTTFNHIGYNAVIAGDSYSNATTMLLQPDGKIVIAGTGTFGADGNDFAIVRYNVDGLLDRSFGDTGVVNIDFDMDDDEAFSLAIKSNGKLIVSGNATIGGNQVFAMACIDSNGRIDSSFGTNGRIYTSILVCSDQIQASAIQPDNKIILGGLGFTGARASGGVGELALARYCNTDEALPKAISTNNVYLFPNPSNGKLFIYGPLNHVTSITANNAAGINIPIQADLNNKQILINDITDGIYFFTIAFNDRPPITQKIIIQIN